MKDCTCWARTRAAKQEREQCAALVIFYQDGWHAKAAPVEKTCVWTMLSFISISVVQLINGAFTAAVQQLKQ